MRKSILALCCLMIAAACSENEKQGNLQISGNIKGLKKGTLYIQKLQDTALVAVDTIKLNGDSTFETAIDIESPEMLYLFLDRGVTNTFDNNLMFFAEPGEIKIDTDLETFYAKAKITGSKNHDLFEEFKKVKSRFTNTDLEITEEILAAYKDGTTAATAEKSAANMKRRYLYTVNFALNNRNHEIAPYVALSEIADANIKYLDTIQKSMSKEVAASKYGKLLTEYVAERKKQQ